MIQSFTARVLEKKKLTKDVILISLKVSKSFSFKAGQFITLMLEDGDVKKPRSYSILSPPSQKEKLDLCIKIVKDGFASEIFKYAEKGMKFDLKGPFGHFTFDKEAKENVFVAAGTGITPLYSMLMEYLSKSKKNFTLIFGT